MYIYVYIYIYTHTPTDAIRHVGDSGDSGMRSAWHPSGLDGTKLSAAAAQDLATVDPARITQQWQLPGWVACRPVI